MASKWKAASGNFWGEVDIILTKFTSRFKAGCDDFINYLK